MKTLAFAFAAAIAVSSVAPAAGAMPLGSLSRQSPAVATAELASIADPAICRDLTCGVHGGKASDISPVFHIIFATVGGFVEKTRLQLITAVSAG